jgi:acyl-coenzyme A thioesterase PaaI-like protein
MGVRSWELDRATAAVTCKVVCAVTDMAGPGVAHGGWTAGVFDDVLGRLPRALGERAVTGTLTVVYRRPVPVERDLELRGRLVGSSSRRRTVEGELRLGSTRALLASATAVMVLVDATHFPRHEQWLAEEDGAPDGPPAPVAGTRRTI